MTQDMYSPTREINLTEGQLNLPAMLQMKNQSIRGEIPAPDGRVLDAELYLDQPQTVRNEDTVDTELEGLFQVLYEDPEGNLQMDVERWQKTVSATVSADADLQITVRQLGTPESGACIGADLQWEENIVAMSPLRMVTGAETGEMITPDPLRPSIILRRAGADSLWEIARSTGSTVDAIRKANSLQQEPAEDQMLLIPIH